jgi:hypothetical protein
MMRRNNTTKVDSTPVITFNYPSHDEIAVMVREAQQMRAQAIRDSARRLWAFLTRRRPETSVAAPVAAKA